MSPEQATGDRDVDPRSDIFALGCVLYEMLSGQPPFSASSAQAVLVKILTMDAPSITSERRTVPPNVGHALARALEKLPADRFASAAEFAAALADPSFTYEARARSSITASTPEPVPTQAPATLPGPWKRLTVAFGTTALLLAGLAAWGWFRPSPQVHATRSLIDLGDISLDVPDKIIVSPDGSRFAVAGAVDGERALYWRNAAEESFRMIPGTENALGASFSPDGDWIVYSSGPGGLFKVSLSGGAPTPVVPSGDVRALFPHWGDDGTIVFFASTGMYRVPDTGGEPVLLRERGQGIFLRPSLLPGGRAVIGDRRRGGIMLLDLESDSIRELIPSGLDPQYVETGHILYADASGGLWALPFDASRLEVLGGAVPIFDGLTVGALGARYSVSQNGTLVYGAGGGGGPGGQQRLLVVDLEGNEEPTRLDPRDFEAARWSPDGESVAYESREPGATAGPDIYTYNVELQTTPRRLTFEGTNGSPVWSPDGTRIAFTSQRDGTDVTDLFVKTVNDDSPPQMIVTLPGRQRPTQWPSDNLVVFENGTGTSDLWMVDLSSDSAVARPYLESEAALRDIMVSPDGNLAAYTSIEAGTGEVYVRSFPEARQPEIVSQGGGDTPSWSPDGNTIYYWTPGGRTATKSLIAARIERGPPFVVTSRDTLMAGTWLVRDSDLHPDGDRWIMPREVSAPGGGGADDEALEPERFLVVVNWFEELLERVGN